MYRIFPAEFFKWCQASPIASWVGTTTWGVAVLQTFHVMGLVFLLGSVFVLNLTVLGIGMKQPHAALVRDVLPWLLFGLAIMLSTGLLMGMAAAVGYSTSVPLAIKMTLLVLAMVLQLAIHLVPGGYDGTFWGKSAAVLSLLLWFGVAYAGRALAFPNLFGQGLG